MERSYWNLVFAWLVWFFICLFFLVLGVFVCFYFCFMSLGIFLFCFVWVFCFVLFLWCSLLLKFSPSWLPKRAATIGDFSQMAFPCMKSTDKTTIILKDLSLHNSAFHSDLYFQSLSTEIVSLFMYPNSNFSISLWTPCNPYICICIPSSSCVSVNSKFLCLIQWGRWLDIMIVTESNNLIGGSFTAKALLHFVLNPVFYMQKRCLTGNGPNTVWCACCNPANNMLSKN